MSGQTILTAKYWWNSYDLQFRLLVTAAAPLLLSHGNGNLLLQNKVSVFAGEVSYAWYLVHWPIVCYQRHFDFHQVFDYPAFIAISFAVAAFLHFVFERQYLKWNYYVTFLAIFLVAFGSIVMQVPLSTVTARDIARVRALSKNYSNLTKEAVIKLNEDMFNLDVPLLSPGNCTFEKPPLLNWQGFCEYEEPYPQRGRNTLMVIGNSWAANVINMVHEECAYHVKNISYYSVGACDVLPDVVKACQMEPNFVEHVERIRPDVLFILSRAIDLKHVDDGMLPLEDSVFAASQRKLEHLQKVVRKKIYILNAFPNISPLITRNVNNYLKTGKMHPKDNTIDPPVGVKVARMRSEELVRRCSKCELLDYVPYLSSNQRVTLYDPETFVTFANSVQHLTLAGQEKVRPLYRDICHRLSQLQ